MAETKSVVKTVFIIYLAIVSLIGLMMSVISASQLIDAGLKTWVFTAADIPSYLENCDDPYSRMPYPEKPVIDGNELTDKEIRANCENRRTKSIENYKIEKARDAVRNFALIIVGIPLFALHFKLFTKERHGYGKKEAKDTKK